MFYGLEVAPVVTTFDIGANLTAVLIALIAGVPAALAAYYGRRASIEGSDAKEAATRAESTAQGTHVLINSRMTELLELTRAEARAAGVLEGAGVQADRPAVAAAIDKLPDPPRTIGEADPLERRP